MAGKRPAQGRVPQSGAVAMPRRRKTVRIQEVRKVRRQRRPGYPTRCQAARDPELLRRHTPPAWKKSAQMTAALSIMLATACAEDGTPQKQSDKVAPLFNHGSGRASGGGVAIVEHKFISEDEARRIIAEELQKAGVTPTGQQVEFKEVSIKYKNKTPGRGGPVTENRETPLKMDLVDPVRKIAVEFVSPGDSAALGGTTIDGTLVTDDIIGVAKSLGDQIRKSPKRPDLYYGIFYDPCVVDNAPRMVTRQAPAPGKVATPATTAPATAPQDLLRAQVKDFIEWLKGQGAI